MREDQNEVDSPTHSCGAEPPGATLPSRCKRPPANPYSYAPYVPDMKQRIPG